MKRSIILFFSFIPAPIFISGLILNWDLRFLSLLVGLSIFSVNLLLWNFVVARLLDSVAESAALQVADDGGHLPTNHSTIELGEQDQEISNAETPPTPIPRKSSPLMVGGILVKILFLIIAVYLCLAVVGLLPLFFVSGFAIGLGLVALASYLSTRRSD